MIELVRKTVRPTVTDGEVRKEFHVHLCVVREREDVGEDEKLLRQRSEGVEMDH